MEEYLQVAIYNIGKRKCAGDLQSVVDKVRIIKKKITNVLKMKI